MPSVRAPTILIVEDDPSSIRTLADMLTPDFDVIIATNEPDAQKLLDSYPDLVLLDLYLQERKTFGLLKQIKSTERLSNTPVICVTSSEDNDDITVAFATGALDYVVKPYNRTILRSKIHTLLDLKRKTELLEEETFTDPLTKVGNRRLFSRQLELEWRRMAREKRNLGLVILDVDNFKQLNDSSGHHVGDKALQHVAQKLRDTAGRASDLVARYGGDEFVLLLPDMALPNLIEFAETVRLAIVDSWHSSAQCPEYETPLTVTLGCASVIPKPDLSPEALFLEGDRQLYLAKQSGRNCVKPDR